MYFEYKTLGTEYILVFLYLTKQLCINKKMYIFVNNSIESEVI